jgi:radical SAM superfamily enzyme YgiQ (UPF0313 family)
MIKSIAMLEPKSDNIHIFSKYELPRLGNIILTTIMKNRGFRAKAYYMSESEFYEEKIEADLIGISTITPTAVAAYKLADYYRKQGKTVVMGGSHVTFLPEEALEHADYCLLGEAEESFPKLIDALNNKKADLNDVPGLAYMNKGKFIINERPGAINNLDSIPHPDFRLLKTSKSLRRLPFFKRIIPIQTSRGCPFNCSFCSVTCMFGKKYRFRSTENIINELKKYNPRKHFIFFYDDNFTANRERAKKLLNEMIRQKLKFNWSTQVRTDIAKDKELLDLMKKAGCKVLYIGFESVDPEALKEMKKNQSVAEIKWSINEIRKRKIHIHGMFVFGFDADNSVKAKTTVDFAIKAKIDTTQFMILTPLPGSDFYKKMCTEERILDYKWETYDAHHVKFKPKRFTLWELQKAQIDAHRKFYSLFQIIRRLWNGRVRAFYTGLYGNRLVKQWLKLERKYLLKLKSSLLNRKLIISS